MDVTRITSSTTNAEAVELLDDFVAQASAAVQVGVWASAFLQHGGEATWDAIKDVSNAADTLTVLAGQVRKLRDHFDAIAP
jgi:hypothetical protein